MVSNKRKHKRLPIRGFLKCSASFDRQGSKFSEIQVLSLSAGGMFLALDRNNIKKIGKNDELNQISFDLGELESLQFSGRVVHCMSLGEIAGCGVEFVAIQDEHQTALDRFVESKLKEFGLWDFC